MIEIKRILCPIDFSDFSRRAVNQAGGLARWYRAEITALHVFFIPVAVPAYAEYPSPTPLGPTVEQLRETAGSFMKPARDMGVTVDVVVEQGDTVRQILASAESLPADLIVLGTHGAGGFQHLVLGSVTEKVLRKAKCPVLTVPVGAPGVPTEKPVYKTILCAVDFSPGSMKALDYALSLAEEADARVIVLHVMEWLDSEHLQLYASYQVSEYSRLLEADARDRLSKAIPPEARDACTPEELLTTGKPYREILRVAKEREAEIIVMGVQGRNALDLMLFGSTTHHVVRTAPCPVLTLRAEAE